jgi:hypothetical protein
MIPWHRGEEEIMNEIFLYISEWGGKEALVGWGVIAAAMVLLAIITALRTLVQRVLGKGEDQKLNRKG